MSIEQSPVEQGFLVHTGTLDAIAAEVARIADGVMGVGDAVATVPTTPPDQYEEWQLGDRSIDLVAPWDDFLHTFADDIRTIGRNLGKTSKLYSGTDRSSSAVFQGILP